MAIEPEEMPDDEAPESEDDGAESDGDSSKEAAETMLQAIEAKDADAFADALDSFLTIRESKGDADSEAPPKKPNLALIIGSKGPSKGR